MPAIQLADWANEYLESGARWGIFPHGRGAGGTYNLLVAMIIDGCRRPVRIIILRQTKNAAKDGALVLLRRLLSDLAIPHNAPATATYATFGAGSSVQLIGSEKMLESLKGLEAVDWLFCEEAQYIGEEAFITVRPSIREPGSRIVVNFNPTLEIDYAWQLYQNPPPGAFCRFLTYRNNPYFTAELESERAYDEAMGNARYRNTWLGELLRAGTLFEPAMLKETDDISYWNPGPNRNSVRAWDVAYSSGSGDYSVGALMTIGPDGTYLLRDIIRGQYDGSELKQRIRAALLADQCPAVVEQMGGNKSWTDDLVREMASEGLNVGTVTPASKTKTERAVGIATAINSGIVYVPKDASWLRDLRYELTAFPTKGIHDDQVDALAYSFMKLAGTNRRAGILI